MKIKVHFIGIKTKTLTFDIESFDTNGRQDSVNDAPKMRTWMNFGEGDFISIGKKVLNKKQILYVEILK